jgi:hypothetical protein
VRGYRIDADVSSARSGDGRGSVPVNVAVIDDGMDATHPDLNVVGVTSCTGGDGKPIPTPMRPVGTARWSAGSSRRSTTASVGWASRPAPGSGRWTPWTTPAMDLPQKSSAASTGDGHAHRLRSHQRHRRRQHEPRPGARARGADRELPRRAAARLRSRNLRGVRRRCDDGRVGRKRHPGLPGLLARHLRRGAGGHGHGRPGRPTGRTGRPVPVPAHRVR